MQGTGYSTMILIASSLLIGCADDESDETSIGGAGGSSSSNTSASGTSSTTGGGEAAPECSFVGGATGEITETFNYTSRCVAPPSGRSAPTTSSSV